MPHEPTYPTLKAALQDSNNGSPSTSGASSPLAHASVVTKESAALWVLFLLVGILIAVFWTDYKEKRILEMRIEGFERALIAHGIKDTYPHLPGEDD